MTEQEIFSAWFQDLVVSSCNQTCLLRDVVRNQRENLWKEFQKLKPFYVLDKEGKNK